MYGDENNGEEKVFAANRGPLPLNASNSFDISIVKSTVPRK